MKLAYYPGCSLSSTAVEYDISTRAVCEALGIELVEIPDWNCCGASSAHSTNELLALALPARNLALAEDMGLDIVAPCAACYNRLAVTNYKLRGDGQLLDKVNGVMEVQYQGGIQVKSLLEVIGSSYGLENIKAKVKKPLTGLKVAAYYGCLLVRPPKMTNFDDPENPMVMDNLLAAIGAEPVTWSHKTECCGGSHSITKAPIVIKLANDILTAAKENAAEALVAACPLCQGNLDMRQPAAEKHYGTKFNLPVYYFTQLLGLALGIDPSLLGLDKHIVDTLALLREKKLA